MPPLLNRSRPPRTRPRLRAGDATARGSRPPVGACSSTACPDRTRPHTSAQSISRRQPSAIRDRGMSLLTVFTVAMLAIVGLAVLTAIVARWWILIPVMAVDLTVTAAVLATVVHLMNDGDGR